MLTEFITKHKLPNEFINKAKYCFMPLAEKILAKKITKQVHYLLVSMAAKARENQH